MRPLESITYSTEKTAKKDIPAPASLERPKASEGGVP
jgi:hypothetical protein